MLKCILYIVYTVVYYAIWYNLNDIRVYILDSGQNEEYIGLVMECFILL